MTVVSEPGSRGGTRRPLRLVGIADADYIHAHKWANYLAARGHRVHLVSFTPVSAAARSALNPAVMLDTWMIPSLHLRRFWITLAAVARLRRIFRTFRADLVQVLFLGHAAWFAALANRHPLSIWVMGNDIEGTSWVPRSQRERFLTPYALGRADLALCWSRNLQKMVRPLLRRNVDCEIVLGGIDSERFRPTPEARALRARLGFEERDLVIFSPRLFWPQFHIETIIRSLPLVRSSQAAGRLLMVKHKAERFPEHERRIEALIDRLALRPFVRVLPGVAPEEMHLYYGAADCTVALANSDGTPLTVIESVACGTPVIVRDLPEYDQDLFVHERTVLKVPSPEPSTIAAAVLRLASDPDLRERLCREGREVMLARCDYQTEMGRLEGLYHSLVERWPRPVA